MTKTERDALIDELQRLCFEYRNAATPVDAEFYWQKIRTHVSAAIPVSDAEPVAWRWHYGGGHVGPWHEMNKFHKPAKEIEYAYAAPPALPDDAMLAAPALDARQEWIEYGLEVSAQWHDERARDTPDAFEMELHQASAAKIRAMKLPLPAAPAPKVPR